MKNGNILRKYTARTLKENRTRTIVTIIGIMLSMALITAVIEGAYSGLQFLYRSEVETSGKWEVSFLDLDQKQFSQLSGEKDIDEVAYFHTVGWAEFRSGNEYKPYLLIESVSDNIEGMIKINLVEGRMPENESEILIPTHTRSVAEVEFNVGDEITLDVGNRTIEGETLGPDVPFTEGESLTGTTTRTYKVVGLYERFDYMIENYSCPGFTALTKGAAEGQHRAFLTLKNVRNIYRYLQTQTISQNAQVHQDLLYYSGVSKNNGLNTMLTGLVVILVLLISLGSVTLIYNSFSISVSERTKQFGILKSIGATGRQIRSAVFYEALLLGIVGIVLGCILGCAGIGITLYFLRDSFSGLIRGVGGEASTVQMKLVLNAGSLAIAAVICLIIVIISAWVPAARAKRIAPIDAIRLSNDIKIKPGKVKTSKLTQKLFGIEGTLAAKNFKRNRKRCRSVIISIFLSVVLFISASTFCAYLKGSVSEMTGKMEDYDIALSVTDENDVISLLQEIKKIPSVDDATYNVADFVYISLGSDVLSAQEGTPFIRNGDYGYGLVRIAFVPDDEFAEMCSINKIDPSSYFDKEHPKALVQNKILNAIYEENGNYKYKTDEVLDMNKDLSGMVLYNIGKIPEAGYVNVDVEEDGTVRVYYERYDTETDTYITTEFPADSVLTEVKFSVGAALKETPYFINDYDFVLVFPEAVMDAVIIPGEASSGINPRIYYLIKARDHVTAESELKTLMEERGCGYSIYDAAAEYESVRAIILIIDVFSYGFIIIISLIAMANIFNTISTNVSLRRREIAMLKSIGLSNRGFAKTMNYESIIYGLRGLLWGLPAAVIVAFAIYLATSQAVVSHFYIPWYSLVIAIGSVFLIVFAAMWYTASKIKHDNVVETLKNENI